MRRIIKNHSNKTCPDELFGRIIYDHGKFDWEKCKCLNNPKLNRYCIKLKDNTKANDTKVIDSLRLKDAEIPFIVLVLESPHISEYDENGNAIGPAQGKTGQKISSCLPKVLESLEKIIGKDAIKEKYNVYIINAVNKQCSMGIQPICSAIKELNFSLAWFKNTKSNGFQKRLSNILMVNGNNKNNIVLNLCTKGEILPLQDFVDGCIKHNFSNIIYAKGVHPSSRSFSSYGLKR